ncbi:MAG TPA: RDD family protein [Anaeromyxobacteraceae bacterium]|nr:RDD family protein [Anaeromyxobacteraceae bacterium]
MAKAGESPARAAASQERLREVVTPEGVPVRFAVALAGDRVGAFIFDVMIIVAILLAIVVPLAILAARGVMEGDLVLAIAVLAVFLVRTFYFVFFELSWQGQTPGKRRLRIRAVDGRGGPLTAEAIIARNLTREVELFLPMAALFSPGLLFPGAPGWAVLSTLAWMLLFGFLPFFNRDRLRVGDLVAGTVVVRTPDAMLLRDLSTAPPPEEVAFSDEQLDVYGEYELHVLEGVLRGRGKPGHAEAVRTVADKVREKIGWEGARVGDEQFLDAFYAALRGRLERRLLFGRRRADKHDRP